MKPTEKCKIFISRKMSDEQFFHVHSEIRAHLDTWAGNIFVDGNAEPKLEVIDAGGARAGDETRTEVAKLRENDRWTHLRVVTAKLSKDEFGLEIEEVGK